MDRIFQQELSLLIEFSHHNSHHITWTLRSDRKLCSCWNLQFLLLAKQKTVLSCRKFNVSEKWKRHYVVLSLLNLASVKNTEKYRDNISTEPFNQRTTGETDAYWDFHWQNWAFCCVKFNISSELNKRRLQAVVLRPKFHEIQLKSCEHRRKKAWI